MKMFLHCHTCTAEPLSFSHQKSESRGCRRGIHEAKRWLAALKLSPPVPRSCKSETIPSRAAPQRRNCSSSSDVCTPWPCPSAAQHISYTLTLPSKAGSHSGPCSWHKLLAARSHKTSLRGQGDKAGLPGESRPAGSHSTALVLLPVLCHSRHSSFLEAVPGRGEVAI